MPLASIPARPGSVAAPELPAVPRPVGVGVRLAVLLRRTTLDRRLARGADPVTSRALALRAGQLAGPRSRDLAVFGLESALSEAQRRGPRYLTSAIAPDRAAVLANRDALLAIVDRLRSPSPVRPAGVARLLVLLRDGAGPLFVTGEPGSLAHELDAIQRALSF